MDLTLALALYAAVVSTAVAAWAVWHHRRGRERLVVEVRPETQATALGRAATRALVVGIVNAGRYPVSLRAVGYRNGRALQPVALPWPYPERLVIPEGERRELRIPTHRLCPSAELLGLYVETSSGRRFHCDAAAVSAMTRSHAWPQR